MTSIAQEIIQPIAEPHSCNDALIQAPGQNKADGLTRYGDVPTAPVLLPLVALRILVLKTKPKLKYQAKTMITNLCF